MINKAWGVYSKKRLTALVTGAPLSVISPAIFRSRALARFYINTILPDLKKKLTIRRVTIKAI